MDQVDYISDDAVRTPASAAEANALKIVPFPVAVTRRSDPEHVIAVCSDDDDDNDDFGSSSTSSIRYCTSTACYSIEQTGRYLVAHRQLSGSRKCIRQRCSSAAAGDDAVSGRTEVDPGCVAEHCCRDLAETEASDGLQLRLSRKRRVNDDVSQCIQSYCSGKLFRERILCIVKNCNRSA